MLFCMLENGKNKMYNYAKILLSIGTGGKLRG